MRFIKFFWFTLGVLCLISLFACDTGVSSSHTSPCASLVKTGVGTPPVEKWWPFKNGEWVSAPLTVPLGSVAKMKMTVQDSLMWIYTVTGRDAKATPGTGIDSLLPYTVDWVAITFREGFRADVRFVDSITFKITWQSRDFDLTWVKETTKIPTTGIVAPPSRARRVVCAE